MPSAALIRAQKKVEAALIALKCAEEKERIREEAKAAKKALKDKIKLELRNDMEYQRKQSQPVLCRICVENNINYTSELLEEFIIWKLNVQGCTNLYQKVIKFIREIDFSDTINVTVKTLNGTCIPLEYSNKKDLQQLSNQLTKLDPDTFPLNNILVIRINNDSKSSIQEGEMFGCIVFPKMFVSFSYLSIHTSNNKPYSDIEYMYTFNIEENAFNCMYHDKYTKFSNTRLLYISHFTLSNKYTTMNTKYLYDTLDELLNHYCDNSYVLKEDAKKELISIFQCVRRA